MAMAMAMAVGAWRVYLKFIYGNFVKLHDVGSGICRWHFIEGKFNRLASAAGPDLASVYMDLVFEIRYSI